jgi:hypothetical protein
MVVQSRRRLAEEVGDLLRRARRLGEELQDPESQGMSERAHLSHPRLERGGAAGGWFTFRHV